MIIICAGKLANTTVGHIDHTMAYAAGFQRLGHEVYVMDQVGLSRCMDASGHPVPFDSWSGRQHFEAIAKAYGLWPRCCLIYQRGKAAHGMTLDEAVAVAKRCEVLVTRSGTIHKVPEIFERPRCRVYIDGNPGSTQWFYEHRAKDFVILDQYEHLFTMGLNIGASPCPLPTGGRTWHGILRPVVLPHWPIADLGESGSFSTISTWKGRTTFEWEGRHSGEKSENWLRFLDLPAKTGQPFDIALRFESTAPHSDRDQFTAKGWQLTDPRQLQTLDHLRAFIGRSRAEFSVAHNRYVEFRTGWFSDRSALYLASGKPVLVQSTGLESQVPVGAGLLTFSTFEDAVTGVQSINDQYAFHRRAAREFAETYLDSDKVLTRLLNTLGYNP